MRILVIRSDTTKALSRLRAAVQVDWSWTLPHAAEIWVPQTNSVPKKKVMDQRTTTVTETRIAQSNGEPVRVTNSRR